MIIVPVPFSSSAYTKKEDARDVVKGQRRAAAIQLVGLAIVYAVMQYFVAPKVFEIYKSFDAPLPLLTQNFSYLAWFIMVISLLAAAYFLSTSPDYSQVDEIANKYKPGEMIKTRELMDKKLELYPIILTTIAIALMVLSIILPIYSLTNQV